MAQIDLHAAKYTAERYVDQLCRRTHFENKLNQLSKEDRFMLDSYLQGFLFAYHSQLQEVLAEKGIDIGDLAD